MKTTVAIIGAGLSGLCAAKHLCIHGVDVAVIERNPHIGGRVQSDERDGFILDRGFQVLLSSYPAARREFNFDNLNLHSFTPGALIRVDNSVSKIFDPIREPSSIAQTIKAKIFPLADQVLIAKLTERLRRKSITNIETDDEVSTLEYLRKLGFSERSIDLFFKPFFGGVFLDTSLQTSSRIFEFTYKMFSEGTACLPRGGMKMLPQELAHVLPQGTILTDTPVSTITKNRITTKNGDEIFADHIIIATDWNEASKLSGLHSQYTSNGTYCSYFAADIPPYSDRCLYLDPDTTSPIQHLSVLTNVCPSYSKDGRALISVSSTSRTSPDRQSAIKAIRGRLFDYFGKSTADWEHLESYWIPHALIHRPAHLDTSAKQSPFTFAGDYLENSSINGALESGRKAALRILTELSILPMNTTETYL